MTLAPIQQHYRHQRDHYPEPFRLRVHRALSWLERAGEAMSAGKQPAVQEEADWDTAFIALWIAFNAAYAKEWEHTSTPSERGSLRDFLGTVCRLDKEQQLYGLVWEKFSASIRGLLDNRYVFQPFWDYHNGKISEAAWLEAFEHSRRKAKQALVQQDTEAVLAVVFDRLYTLRNQMVHGGATYRSSANRQQVRNGCLFLSECITLILHIMMQHPDHEAWGKPFYPFIKE